ncbi:hypothetical protein KUV89_17935 [Marinobacter hydrocarbonoclasticus]|nr:hypothetical protein [Marinobacter nauticus]
MLIIWRGLGWLVPVLVAVVFVGMQLLLNSLFGEGTYRAEGWSLWLTVGIASVLIGFFGLLVNQRDGEEGHRRSHALFFIPVQYWALLLPLLVGGLEYAEGQKEDRMATYLAQPQVGDHYLLDLRNVFDDVDGEFPYGAMKVVAVNNSGVKVVLSEYQFDQRAGIREAIREQNENSGFAEESSFHFGFDEIEALVADEEIFDIQRF